MGIEYIDFETISKYNYVSFDLYDTLIFRPLYHYTRVFDIVEKIYNQHSIEKITHFKRIRIQAERAARLEKRGAEVSLNAIYSKIKKKHIDKKKLQEIEVQTEIDLCMPNSEMISLLKRCKDNNKIIIITSDMYLPEFAIKKILKKHDIVMDYLYLSSEYGETKRSGNLFKYIFSSLKIDNKELIHIGDDYNNDYLMPQKLGIRSMLYIPINPKLPINRFKSIDQEIISLLLSRDINFKSDLERNTETIKYCYSILGPLLVEFCHWIHQMKVSFNLEALYFIAREGWLLKRVYDIIYPNEDTQYIYLNKNLLRVPCMDLSPNFDSNASKQIKEQKELLKKYLNQCRLINRKVGLVNNSINGNAQRMLEQFCSEQGLDSELYGLQLLRSAECKYILKDRSNSWLDEDMVSKTNLFIFYKYCLIFERLLFKPEGTALGLCYKNNVVKVEKKKQYSEVDDNRRINEIQDKVLEFVRLIKGIQFPIEKYNSFNNYVHTLIFPTKDVGGILTSLHDDDLQGESSTLMTDVEKSFSFKNLISSSRTKNLYWPEGYAIVRRRKMVLFLLGIKYRFQKILKKGRI